MANKPDFTKVVATVDYYLLRRMDLTEKEVKTLSSLCLCLYGATTLYLLGKINKLHEELKEIKNLKGD